MAELLDGRSLEISSTLTILAAPMKRDTGKKLGTPQTGFANVIRYIFIFRIAEIDRPITTCITSGPWPDVPSMCDEIGSKPVRERARVVSTIQ
jgi:hypothetical protein